jgi:AcrR family transcriptional regulator
MSMDTKNNLLKVTRNLIDKRGINEISMRTVGKAVHLSRCAIYRHFENKESLLAAIVVENFSMLKEKFSKLEESVSNPRQLLFDLSMTYYDFGIQNPDHYQLMFNTKWDETKYPDLRQAAVGIFSKVAFLVSNALAPKHRDRKTIQMKTAILYALIHGIVELHIAGHNEAEKGLDDVTLLINDVLEAILEK